eukprot:6189799-Pleurochrysis_carterae.AAC.1
MTLDADPHRRSASARRSSRETISIHTCANSTRNLSARLAGRNSECAGAGNASPRLKCMVSVVTKTKRSWPCLRSQTVASQQLQQCLRKAQPSHSHHHHHHHHQRQQQQQQQRPPSSPPNRRHGQPQFAPEMAEIGSNIESKIGSKIDNMIGSDIGMN